ncbi:hypothetical protein Acsp04_12380 [Actinomadura sp. NBRC 104425]|uniref:hypothetical protein n=1 Tax=Actinomadura sp. NBRC 104425 TaxID=3032204 RepID=UPI0024A15EB1|nr:hypothetical protein [Actinomadura sp. NBRC 104425]GLZ11003.1 hypothetical protein Acsp04_12380 [Actinomadura sp. NBRC 104425]
MHPRKWPVYTPLAREHYGKGYAEGLEEGLEKGRREGREETAKLMVNVVLEVLSTHGVTVTEDARERITTCTDIERLATWAARADTVRTIDDLFA